MFQYFISTALYLYKITGKKDCRTAHTHSAAQHNIMIIQYYCLGVFFYLDRRVSYITLVSTNKW